MLKSDEIMIKALVWIYLLVYNIYMYILYSSRNRTSTSVYMYLFLIIFIFLQSVYMVDCMWCMFVYCMNFVMFAIYMLYMGPLISNKRIYYYYYYYYVLDKSNEWYILFV